MSFLKKPVLSKSIQRCGNEHVKAGVAAMQGYRGEMEDAHVCVLAMPRHANTSFFAVFDGHSGSKCSKWLALNLMTYIDEVEEFEEESIQNACLKADQDFLSQFKDTLKKQYSGSTAVFVLVIHEEHQEYKKIIIGHVGDSRALLIQPKPNTCLELTQDHKPLSPCEWQRIINAGWTIDRNRVGGNLAMSRAFGDFEYKSNSSLLPLQQAVIALPDISTHYVSHDDLLLLSCDGITDVMDATLLTSFVANLFSIDKTWDPAWTIVLLQDKCIQLASHDNMTGILLSFGDGKEYGDPDNSKIGYLPGPWLSTARDATRMDYGELAYCLAYNHFARKHGYNTTESVAMAALNESLGIYAPNIAESNVKPMHMSVPPVDFNQSSHTLPTDE